MVIFPRAPPLSPPSIEQTYQRQLFVAAARAWRELDQADQRKWERAARRASLKITGYNLFVFWSTRRERTYIQTIERSAGIRLL